jgi:tetratricopeptide (TPR) repeat protein
MPTLDEAKTAMSFKTFYPGSRGVTGHSQKNSAIVHDPANAFPPDPNDDLVFKGGLYGVTAGTQLWTSTRVGDSAWTLTPLALEDYSLQEITKRRSLTSGMDTFCVRPMEPDLLQFAKEAQVTSPVPDVQTLKAYVPIAQAHASFKAGQYQAAMTEANGALAIEPKFAPAYWAMGVSAGMLGQWDQAIANLQTAVKIDKNYNNGNAALKWAEEGQKAAKKGESPKDKAPVWE